MGTYFPSIAPTQLGKFHTFSKSSAFFSIVSLVQGGTSFLSCLHISVLVVCLFDKMKQYDVEYHPKLDT